MYIVSFRWQIPRPDFICYMHPQSHQSFLLLLISKFFVVINGLVNTDVNFISRNEITRLRVYELFARMSRLSEESFIMFKTSIILKSLISEFGSADFLLKMNLIELFKKVCFLYDSSIS